MRSLSTTLLAKQKKKFLTPLVKIVLTSGATTYTYTKSRILDINHPEQPYNQKAEVLLDNSDSALNDIDLKGYKAVISCGAITSAGDEYSVFAPLWVISQQFNSLPGKLDCTLSLIGIPNLLAEDRANTVYQPDDTDTKTVKTLLTEIITATLACFSHCKAYEVVWDSEDSLIDVYMPKDSLRIYTGNSRLAIIRRLLDFTKCMMIAKADGKIHILQPTISGETYDYEYSLSTGHAFFSKSYRNRLVIPNYIVVQSQPDDVPQYSGYAQDAPSVAAIGEIRQYEQTYLVSDAQGTAIAEAMLSKYQLWAEAGSADVPMNVGAEVFDYVKVTDERQGDERTGNLGSLTRHVNLEKKEWRMTFSFGGWLSVRKLLNDIETNPSGVGSAGQNLARLNQKDLYAELIAAHQLYVAKHFLEDAVWADDSPSAGYVAWSGAKVTYKGVTYTITDGNTNKKYIWWDYSLSKTTFQASDTKPDLTDDDFLAATNTSGVHRLVWNATLIDGGNIKTNTINADELNMVWIDPDNTIDLSKIGDDLDHLPDGTVYARTKSLHLDADGALLSENILYAIRFDPDIAERGITKSTTAPTSPEIFDYWVDISGASPIVKRWSGSAWETLTDDQRKELERGVIYRRVKEASLTTDGLVVLDQVYIDDASGQYSLMNRTAIQAGYALLSSVIQSAQYRTLSDAEKATYLAKTKTFRQATAPTSGMQAGDIWFDTGNGDKPYTYSGSQWIAAFTEIDGGYLTTGVINCSVVNVKAGGGTGAVVLNSEGILCDAAVSGTWGRYRLKYGTYTASVGITSLGHLLLVTGIGKEIILQNLLNVQSYVVSNLITNATKDLGNLTYPWNNVYGKYFRPPTTGGFILKTVAVAEAGSLKWDGAGGLYVHECSSWRHIT